MTLSLRRRLDFLLGVPLVNLMGVWARKTSAPPSKPDRILVTKLAAIGDTALLIPVLKALREGYPQAEIHWLVSRINQDLAQRVPYVNRIFVLKEFHPVALFDLIRELKRQRYDIGIDFEQWSRTTALLIFLAGISFRIGFKTQGQCRSALFDCAYPRSNHQHEIENFAGLLSLLGVRTMDKELKLWEDPKAAEWAERKIGEDSGGRRGPVIIFHPGCGKGGRPREWPVLSYLQLAEALRKKLGEIHLIITGGEEDKGKSGFFSQRLPGAINLIGRTSVLEMSSLVRRSHLVVSGSTSIAHIAAAWRVPQVALHGPTSALRWGPLNPLARVVQTRCQICPVLDLGFEYHTSTDKCMRRIDFGEVLSACLSLIKPAKR